MNALKNDEKESTQCNFNPQLMVHHTSALLHTAPPHLLKLMPKKYKFDL